MYSNHDTASELQMLEADNAKGYGGTMMLCAWMMLAYGKLTHSPVWAPRPGWRFESSQDMLRPQVTRKK